jgi:hypothetical protein
MAGLFDKLMSDPYNINLALNGLGLLGSKHKSSANQYMDRASQSLLGKAQAQAQAKRDAEQKRVNDSVIDYNTARAGAEARPPGFFPGTGAESSALQVVSTLGPRKQQNLPMTPEEETALAAAMSFLSQPQQGYGPDNQPFTRPGMNFDFLSGGAPPPQVPGPQGVPGAAAPGQMPPQVPGSLPGQPPQSPPAPTVVQPQGPPPLNGAMPTPGQVKSDEAMATEYVDWSTKGQAESEKALGQLYGALGNLQSGNVKTGDYKALLSSLAPDKFVSFLRPDYMNTKEQVQEVVQKNLVATLGAQFAEREGDRVIARAYNENVDTDLNIDRIQRLVKQIVATTDAKAKAMDYYSKFGTMRGYDPQINSMADLQAKLEADFLAGVGESDDEKRLNELKKELGVE